MENERTNWRSALWRGLIAGLALSGASSLPLGPAEREIVSALLSQRPSRRDVRCCAAVSADACCAATLGPCCAAG